MCIRDRLDDGWADYYDGQDTLDREIRNGRQELADAKEQLERSEADLAEGRERYEDGLAQYQDGLKQYEDLSLIHIWSSQIWEASSTFSRAVRFCTKL